MSFARATRRSLAIVAALALTSGCLSGGGDGPSGGSDPGPGGQQLTEATAYPSTCLDTRLAGREGKALKEHRQVREARTYAGTSGGSLILSVTSHDIPVPEKLFDDAGAAQGECASSR